MARADVWVAAYVLRQQYDEGAQRQEMARLEATRRELGLNRMVPLENQPLHMIGNLVLSG